MELTAELLNNAMSLSQSDRAELAHRLLVSLNGEEADPDVEAAWAVEVQRRIELAEKDPSRLRDFETALDEIEASVRTRSKS